MADAVLGALVGGVLVAVTKNVVALVTQLAGKGYNLWSNFDKDINFIKMELVMITAAEEDQLTEELRDLALEIEDLLQQILRHVVRRDKGPLHKAIGFADGLQLEAKVEDLKKRLKKAHRRRIDHRVHGGQVSAVSTPTANTYMTTVGRAVGIGESKREIREWVMKDVEGQPEQLNVMSIVGFSGSGKSTLASEVYGCHDVTRKFPHRAWVVVSAHSGDAKKILEDLFEELVKGDKVSESLGIEQLRAKISNYLKKTERYLIVLDDIKNQTWWDHLKSAFPEKETGRIIVTTTMKRVAKDCRRGSGYVHNMELLDDKHSMELLNDVLKGHPTDLERCSTSIRNKCDGHPHSLVSVANHLRGEDSITKRFCDELCNNLGSRMVTADAFEELQKVLMNNYRSLPKGFLNLKTCLLYACVFPNGGNIRRSRLVRRCCAEGYVQYDHPCSALDVAEDNFNKLVEHSIFWPIDTRKDANVKTCRAHSIFHEFLLHMSKSAKFITSFDNKYRRHYRHLLIHTTSSNKSGYDEEKSRAHSLTICGSAGKAIGYLANCQLLKVLDVEDCDDLKNEDLDGLHKLWSLKYLSVGDTITRPPKNIEKLYFLETLDMRKTKNDIILPADIIKLPHLEHLLGRFKLDNKHNWDKSKPEKYVPEKSVLQTLAGFVTDQEPGFEMLMVHMKQLRKVKIWAVSRNTNSAGEDPHLARAIQNFVQAEEDTGASRSLTLDICSAYGNILRSLTGGCLGSLKLHGELKGLVHFAKSLSGLKELSLSSTNDLTAIDLRELSCLDLVCLKLVGVSFVGFVIQCEDFEALRCLCLVQCPDLPQIKKGTLPNLLSLKILNQDLHGLSGIEIDWHKSLGEIYLDSEVKSQTKTEWKNAAKNHRNRPRVLYLKRVSPNGNGSMVKYVASEKPLLGDTSSITLEKRPMDDTVQSNSFEKHRSKQLRVADPSPASTAMEIDMPSTYSSRVR